MSFSGYAIIIGAMKSGTTTLHHLLKQHPGIVSGVRKELNFFRPKRSPNELVPAYEALFPHLDKERHAYTLDSSTNYTKPGIWSIAPSLIAQLPGRKRLIYILRNPIDRIDSHIAHNIAQGRWTVDDWPEDHVVSISAYARQIAKFEAVGLLDDILLLDFAELCADPVNVTYRVHDFLGIQRIQPKSVGRRNPRKINGSFVRQDDLPRLAELLHDDVETLITRYGFEPARSWGIEGIPRKQEPRTGRPVRASAAGPLTPIEELRYVRGFLIGAQNGRAVEHFRRVEFPLPLAVHPRTRIGLATNAAEPLAVLGEAIHPDLPHLDLQGIAEHLADNPHTRQREIDKLVGRFAVIHKVRDDFTIQTDAIGMRSVFFALSDEGVVAGSHASLVAQAASVEPARKETRRFRWGYPGMSTPYASVFRLPPNCELSLTRGNLTRFFPDAPIPEVGIEQAWDLAFSRADSTVKALAKRQKLLVSLTAGLDSRTTLAASRASWPHLLFFTYNRGNHKHQVDTGVALDLTTALGLPHTIVRYSQSEPNRRMLKLIAENAFTSHQRKVACAYHRQFGEDVYLHIRSNLLELSRSNLFYKLGKRQGLESPDTAEKMGAVYNHAAKLTAESAPHVTPAFEQYIALSHYEAAVGKASPWDLYFVEHRMGAWHSGVVLESDVSFDTVIAFNSREVVRQFMGVPQEIRWSNPHLRDRLAAVLPEVADIPINPQRYVRHSVVKLTAS